MSSPELLSNDKGSNLKGNDRNNDSFGDIDTF